MAILFIVIMWYYELSMVGVSWLLWLKCVLELMPVVLIKHQSVKCEFSIAACARGA
jgi:hypothetical protein